MPCVRPSFNVVQSRAGMTFKLTIKSDITLFETRKYRSNHVQEEAIEGYFYI